MVVTSVVCRITYATISDSIYQEPAVKTQFGPGGTLLTTIALALIVRPLSSISLHTTTPAVVLPPRLALLTLQASTRLRTNTNTVADLDVLDVLADAHGLADDLVADTAWVGRGEPAGLERVQVTAADTAVGDLGVGLAWLM